MVSSQVGTYSRLRLEHQLTSNAAGNYTDVAWQLYFEETSGSNNLAWDSSVTASVAMSGFGTLWSGTFAFDWRPGGLQSVQVVHGSTRVYHNADGTHSTVTLSAANGSTGSTGGGSGGSVSGSVAFPTLKVVPNTPTGVVATRISDTQTSLSWTQTNASNGAPTAVLVQQRINNGAWADLVTSGNVTTITVASSANEKIEYRVQSSNAAGTTAFSDPSSPIYTTPAPPSAVTAIKDVTLNINVSFTDNVAYVEHTHEVWHGTVTGGVTTWDGAPLATLPSGTTTYAHATPDPSKVHIYEVRAVGGGLDSAFVQSASVQLLAAPNKPTTPAMTPFADKAAALDFTWVHNPVDTTPQKAYEFQWSTNGGTTWAGTGKVVSTVALRTIAANTYASGVALTTRVRTWGSATTGGSDGTGASPWSDLRTVTYKTAPTASITAPANGATLTDSTVRATIGFTQPEGATFVKAQLQLLQGATVLETMDTTIQVGVKLSTPVQDGVAYSLKARVQDSNGLWSAWVTNNFTVDYLAPVPAVVDLSFLQDTGFGQIALAIAAPGAGQAAAVTVGITRTINGLEETVVDSYPVSAALTFLDTTPVVNGTNTYKVTTTSALGAQSVVTQDLVTSELRRAYLSKGVSFSNVVVFGGNLSVEEDLTVASDTLQAAGRTKPIGLYGIETLVQLKVSSRMVEIIGSSIDQVRSLLLVPGKACYRDPSGRRIFGSVKGSIGYKSATRGDLSFTLTETS